MASNREYLTDLFEAMYAEHSKREGISMNQYCVYLLSKNDATFSK